MQAKKRLRQPFFVASAAQGRNQDFAAVFLAAPFAASGATIFIF